MVISNKKIHKRKELHIIMDDKVYHFEFHTTDLKHGILNIMPHKRDNIEQQKWVRVE